METKQESNTDDIKYAPARETVTSHYWIRGLRNEIILIYYEICINKSVRGKWMDTCEKYLLS